MLLPILLVCAIQAGEPVAVPSRLAEVTVFASSALVKREVELASGSGRFVISGLPIALDPDSVRVRCTGAEVTGLETRERFQPSVPGERVEELRQRGRAIERELAALADERQVLDQVAGHLQHLVAAKPASDKDDAAAASGPNAWRANVDYLSKQLAANRASLRENAWKTEEVEQRLANVKLELDGAAAGQGVRLRDVIVEVSGGAGAARLELEYLVSSAGWRPRYDLRTAANASSVDLSYRAQVWQQSGEDWSEVELALSTAQPRRGAQGPDPEPIWLRMNEIERASARGLKELGYVDGAVNAPPASPAPRPFATVESQGLSVRFRLATRESIQSRSEPTTVLIGQTTLAVMPEYYATPSLDSNVWLRAKAKNTSEWTLLAGTAAVYFGADFLGQAQIEPVQPGAELVLHLGPDPALAIERAQLEDLTSGPGLFGSKASRKQGFRVTLKNHGAAAARADRSALVFLREALPRSTDDRIQIELADSKPAPSQEERFTYDREERGIVTWPVVVPRGGEATLAYTTKIAYPDGARLIER